MKNYMHFINGQFSEPSSGQYFDTENPYTGKIWARVARGNTDDVERAVKAAHNAFNGDWSNVTATNRGKLLGGIL